MTSTPPSDELDITTPPELPLHVQVAEATGWFRITGPLSSIIADSGMRYEGHPPRPFILGEPPIEIARYDRDWNAAGPLLSYYKFTLLPSTEAETPGWWATGNEHIGIGPTPQIAICNLILALRAVGKIAPRGKGEADEVGTA